jgi:hypothetical protein
VTSAQVIPVASAVRFVKNIANYGLVVFDAQQGHESQPREDEEDARK